MYASIKRYCDQNPRKATYFEFALVGFLSMVIGGFGMSYLGSIVTNSIGIQNSPVPVIFGASFGVLMIQLYDFMRKSDLNKLKLSPEIRQQLVISATVSNLVASLLLCVGLYLFW